LISVKKNILILSKKEDQPADPPTENSQGFTRDVGTAFSLKGVLKGHTDLVTDIVEVPSCVKGGSSLIWTASRDLSIRVWDIDKDKSRNLVPVKEILNAHKSWVQCLAVVGPLQVLSGASDGKIKSWSTKTYTSNEFPDHHTKDIQSMYWSKRNVLWVGSVDKTVTVWQ